MDGDAKCIAAQSRIPDWVLSHEAQTALYATVYGTAPDLIYTRGVPDTPSPGPSTFDRNKCNHILIEIGFYMDFGCHTGLQEKTTKYAPLVTTL
jgi:hypothetical protein